MPAQTWNTPEVRAVVDRAITRRSTVQADSGLRTFRARAHGFVFFLGQMGEGFPEPPRLIKSDQLALEVYWQSPGRSKQIIIGRRDRRDLPTDIQYHHLTSKAQAFMVWSRENECLSWDDTVEYLAVMSEALLDPVAERGVEIL